MITPKLRPKTAWWNYGIVMMTPTYDMTTGNSSPEQICSPSIKNKLPTLTSKLRLASVCTHRSDVTIKHFMKLIQYWWLGDWRHDDNKEPASLSCTPSGDSTQVDKNVVTFAWNDNRMSDCTHSDPNNGTDLAPTLPARFRVHGDVIEGAVTHMIHQNQIAYFFH